MKNLKTPYQCQIPICILRIGLPAHGQVTLELENGTERTTLAAKAGTGSMTSSSIARGLEALKIGPSTLKPEQSMIRTVTRMTALTNESDVTANNETTWVALRLWGHQLDPDVVGSYFSVEPSEAYAAGLRKTLPSGELTPPRELGAWFFKRSIRKDLNAEIAQFLTDLGENKPNEAPGVEICILDIYFGLADEESNLRRAHEYRLSNEVIAAIATKGVELRITIA
jgi:hypothetical protein